MVDNRNGGGREAQQKYQLRNVATQDGGHIGSRWSWFGDKGIEKKPESMKAAEFF